MHNNMTVLCRRWPGVVAAVLLGGLLLLPARGVSSGSAPVAVDYEIRLVSGNATQNADGSWTVQVGERIEWAVTWTVANISAGTVFNVRLGNNYSAEIDVAPSSVDASRGQVTVAPVGGPNSATAVAWSIGDMPAGSTAVLSFHIATGLNPAGKQQYTSPGDYCLDSALTVKWDNGSVSKGGYSLNCVPVHVGDPPWMRIEITNTQKDWRIRKPGDYVSLGLQVIVASNSSVSIQFRDFADLMPLAGNAASPLPVLYAAGDSLQQASQAGWWTADELNQQVISFRKSDALEQGVTWSLWQRLVVGPSQSSSEYEDQATLVFVLANAGQLVVDSGSP
ncbi:MAG: hypothetical protein AB1609_08140 [Bacillota bacterium]